VAVLRLGERGAHLGLGLLRGHRRVAQLVGDELAIRQEASLLVEPGGQLLTRRLSTSASVDCARIWRSSSPMRLPGLLRLQALLGQLLLYIADSLVL